MTPKLRVPLDGLEAGERALMGDARRYVTKVHRLGEGDGFVAFDPVARLECDAVLVGRDAVRLSSVRAASHVAVRSVTLIQALAKGTKVADVIRDATELGATRIVPAIAERSVKRGGELDRWRRVAVEAARQCGRGDVPVIDAPVDLREALRSARVEGAALVMLSADGRPFGDMAPRDGAIVLVVGPEGGFSDGEVEEALALGYVRASLGRFVLRTETACAAALGTLSSNLPPPEGGPP